jgi:hypothetical protein
METLVRERNSSQSNFTRKNKHKNLSWSRYFCLELKDKLNENKVILTFSNFIINPDFLGTLKERNFQQSHLLRRADRLILYQRLP